MSPIGLHYSMFMPTIRGQGTEEQVKKWLPLAESHKIIGTYVQTELGHGVYCMPLHGEMLHYGFLGLWYITENIIFPLNTGGAVL